MLAPIPRPWTASRRKSSCVVISTPWSPWSRTQPTRSSGPRNSQESKGRCSREAPSSSSSTSKAGTPIGTQKSPSWQKSITIRSKIRSESTSAAFANPTSRRSGSQWKIWRRTSSQWWSRFCSSPTTNQRPARWSRRFRQSWRAISQNGRKRRGSGPKSTPTDYAWGGRWLVKVCIMWARGWYKIN